MSGLDSVETITRGRACGASEAFGPGGAATSAHGQLSMAGRDQQSPYHGTPNHGGMKQPIRSNPQTHSYTFTLPKFYLRVRAAHLAEDDRGSVLTVGFHSIILSLIRSHFQPLHSKSFPAELWSSRFFVLLVPLSLKLFSHPTAILPKPIIVPWRVSITHKSWSDYI
jgi:hypothetical protein